MPVDTYNGSARIVDSYCFVIGPPDARPAGTQCWISLYWKFPAPHFSRFPARKYNGRAVTRAISPLPPSIRPLSPRFPFSRIQSCRFDRCPTSFWFRSKGEEGRERRGVMVVVVSWCIGANWNEVRLVVRQVIFFDIFGWWIRMVDVFDEFPREFLLFSFLFCLICCLKLDGSFFFFWIYYEMYKELFCFKVFKF